jgi:iron(II)-dependent oxidoreductase
MKGFAAVLVGLACLTAPAQGQEIEWVTIPGGQFQLGTTYFKDARPIPGKFYTIQTFEMSKTVVTVEQYKACVLEGGCVAPSTGTYCNWGKKVRERLKHPVNCINWQQADKFAKLMGVRLPSEAEWEYAATSGGKKQKYPWGDEDATCERAVMYGNGDYGCGKGTTMPVCSKPKGNTIQGLCDMAGNVWQWVQDKYQDSYTDTPADGSPLETGVGRVMRGGSFGSQGAGNLRVGSRARGGETTHGAGVGFRLVRQSR